MVTDIKTTHRIDKRSKKIVKSITISPKLNDMMTAYTERTGITASALIEERIMLYFRQQRIVRMLNSNDNEDDFQDMYEG